MAKDSSHSSMLKMKTLGKGPLKIIYMYCSFLFFSFLLLSIDGFGISIRDFKLV
jgi:hypothetical protein